MNFVSKDPLTGIVYASSAVVVWDDLKERFDKVGYSRIFQIHREIATAAQGTQCTEFNSYLFFEIESWLGWVWFPSTYSRMCLLEISWYHRFHAIPKDSSVFYGLEWNLRTSSCSNSYDDFCPICEQGLLDVSWKRTTKGQLLVLFPLLRWQAWLPWWVIHGFPLQSQRKNGTWYVIFARKKGRIKLNAIKLWAILLILV